MNGAAIEASGLSKSFGQTVVLDGVDLTVPEGIIFALLGPNGAGKTTMVRILSTLIAADSGRASVAGCDVASDPDGVRAAIGVTGQFSAVDDLLTGEQNLRLMADLNHLGRDRGTQRVAELLERFDLVAAARKPVATYSGGMRRRLDLAMTLMGSPRVIFLDEPTTGLDPRGRHTMWQAIRDLVADGVTIFLTTQYLDEADELAHLVAVLDRGRIVAAGHGRRAQATHPRRPCSSAVHRAAGPARGRTSARCPCPRRGEPQHAGAQRWEHCRASSPSGPTRRCWCAHRAAVRPLSRLGRRVLRRHRSPRRTARSRLMSTLALTYTDSATMLRRNLRRLLQYPSLTLLLVGMPIVFLLLFVYVFGGQLGAGLGHRLAGGHTGRAGYLNYVTPGILLMTVAAAVQGTAIVVAMDMTGGIIDRFRTMPIARSCVLTGHVLATLIQTVASLAVVLAVSIALGFRPTADPADWLAAIGISLLFAFALIWLATALGLAAKSVETASNTPMFLTLLPFLGSGFVPTATMPAGLRQFATYQPFTPVTETLRGLLTGTHVGGNAIEAVAWSVGIAVASYLWARHLYSRRSAGS